ncbi:MAG: DUF2059 domain-containing protein [Verrucomicrobiota bacterium]
MHSSEPFWAAELSLQFKHSPRPDRSLSLGLGNIPRLPMKRTYLTFLATAFFAFTLLSTVPAAEEAQRQKIAEQIVDVLWSKELLIETGKLSFRKNHLEPLIKKGLSQEAAKETEAALERYLLKISELPSIRSKLSLVFSSNYTADELSQILAFYQTPVGQKSFRGLTLFNNQLRGVTGDLFEEQGGEFRAEAAEIMRRHSKAK